MTPPTIESLAEVQHALLRWHTEQGLHAPWRESGDPYHAMVAAFMAQQTQMSRVMPSYERFLAVFPTLDALASASAGDVIRAWEGMGYNQRAVRLHRAARRIAADGWPLTAGELAHIPGIGAFTAAIIASFAFREPAACVDTNVRRVLGRLAGAEHLSSAQMRSLADHSLAVQHPARWNQALMDYGALVCLPRPKCAQCVVSSWCRSSAAAAAQPLRVAEDRAGYATKKPKLQQEPYRNSRRYVRGRIIDLLRNVDPADALAIAAIPELIPNQPPSLTLEDVISLVDDLVRDGLAEKHDGLVSLPRD